MSDYVSCPTCRGRGLLALEDAQRIEIHDLVIADERRQQRCAQEERVMAAQMARVEDARRRQEDLERTVFGLLGPAAEGTEPASDRA
jgi:hypothetical protein